MTDLVVVPPTKQEAARLNIIEQGLETLAKASGQVLRDAITDVPRFAALLDALVGKDEEWQRRFKREVVLALQRLPRWGQSDVVPRRFGLQVLHSCLVTDGARPAIDLLTQPGTPSWTDLIRLYRPDYAMGNRVTLDQHAAEIAGQRTTVSMGRPAGHQPRERFKPAPAKLTVRRLRELVAGQRHDLEMSQALLARCEAADMADNEPVPNTWLTPKAPPGRHS